MEKLISATEARRRFRSVLRDVEAGNSYVVTMRGVPVARIKPEPKQQSRSKAKAALLKRLGAQKAIDIGPWTRGELYD